MAFFTFRLHATLPEARTFALDLAREEVSTAVMFFRPRSTDAGLRLLLKGAGSLDHAEVAAAIQAHGFRGGQFVRGDLELFEPIRATGLAAEEARSDVHQRLSAAARELGLVGIDEERGHAEVYVQGDRFEEPPPDWADTDSASKELIKVVCLLRGPEGRVQAVLQEAGRRADLISREGADWREGIECERCLRWEGNPPVPLGEARRRFPRDLGFEAVHGCYLCTDAAGRPWHVPTTMVSGNGHYFQWFPELPPGQKPCGGVER